ncbi:Aspartate/glutamate/uridylate kinase [Fomitopsis serialis]|uniref:Aspartate/glutamate/uridylate kinase n=1 Tax=Fomitopsis serialis TaxID=139415 RepID=UPI002008BB50|nr:Aspartate/glutamate/uridylate kinase [Neoantrodia serialis]KAH9932181.1 Aspartate/glutamate/uridylate kinase [Neoantrodia serialis]
MSNPPSSSSSSRSSSMASSSLPRTPPNMHQNTIDPEAKWLVQKFGGTSVGKFATKIAEDIIAEYIDQHKVAIVCSARSGSTKALGTTNLLLRAAKEALQRTSSPSETPGHMTPALFSRTSQAQSPVDSPRGRSTSSPRMDPVTPGGALNMSSMSTKAPPFSETVDLIPELLRELEMEIERDCDSLRSFWGVIDEISPRSRDTIIGFGERLACKVMTAILRDRGIDAEYVSLENVVPLTEEESYTGETLGQEFYDRVAEAVSERIKQCEPRVPVVTGYFGPVPGSLLRQVGRGYTDLLAALLAAGLGASELQIWKEVDGIFTADPRKVPTARLIPIISPEEAAELTYYGSEVVHPFTMEQVIRRRIPIRIKNVENPQGGGTVIHPDPDIDAAPYTEEAGIPIPGTSTVFRPVGDLHAARDERKLPTAVTIKERIVVLNVNSNRKSVSHGFLAGVFGTLDRYGVVVDLISTSEVYVSMAIEDNLDKKLLDRVVRELQKSGTVTVSRDMAILSLVGKRMRNMVGIAGRMFTTLGDGKVNIEMISQGANEINISCVIDSRDAVKALNLIHQSCLQIRPDGARGRMGPWLF